MCLLLCFAVYLASASCALPVQAQSGKTLYDRVLKSGKIKCAYVVSDPGCIRDPNTKKLRGIGPDVLEKVAKNLGLQLDWSEEVGWSTMIEGLRTNRYDMVACPIWANAVRAKFVDFSHPLYFSQVCAYVKTGNTKFSKDLSLLNSDQVRVSTIDGEMADMIARADFPKAKRVSLPQLSDLSQMLLNVSTNKADVTFAEPSVAVGFMKRNPNALTNIIPNRPIRVFPNTFLFNKNEEAFKSMLDVSIDEVINSGEVDTIIRKYEPYPNACRRVAKPYQ